MSGRKLVFRRQFIRYVDGEVNAQLTVAYTIVGVSVYFDFVIGPDVVVRGRVYLSWLTCC